MHPALHLPPGRAPVSRRPRRDFVTPAVALACLLAPALVHAQSMLKIDDPHGPGERLGVFAMDDGYCLVDTGYGAQSVHADYFYLAPALGYADGFLEVNRPKKWFQWERGRRALHLDFQVRASRDYDNCFLVLRIYTDYGRQFLAPIEIGDIRAGQAQSIKVEPELAEEASSGQFGYYFFSEGKEIYYALTSANLKKASPGAAAGVALGARPAFERLPDRDLPPALAQTVSGGEAVVSVGVNDRGFTVDHLVLQSTNSAAGQVAVDLIKKSRFQPPDLGARSARQSMLLQVDFDHEGNYSIAALD